MKRICYICSKEVFECMGSVHAGDFVKFLFDKNIKVRELCPLCATFYANYLTEHSNLSDYPGQK